MRDHIFSIPELIKKELDRMLAEAESSLAAFQGKEIDRIFLTGCGYSYGACLSAGYGLQEMTGKQVTVLPAIEASLFLRLPEALYRTTLVIGISNSGQVTRVNEALAFYREKGAMTLGLTGNPAGEILKYCEASMDISSPAFGRPLPLRGCAMTMAALFGIGCAFKGDRDQAGLLAAGLVDSMGELEEMLPSIDRETKGYVTKHRSLDHFEFIGSGYERGAAFLGKIEMMGQAGLMAVDEDAEQWLHCNFFMAQPQQIGTVLFLSKHSPGASRAREAYFYMKHLGRPVCVATDEEGLTSDELVTVVHLPGINPVNAGILEMTVPSLLTYDYCKLRGEEYSRGFKGSWALFQDGRGTTKSYSEILEKWK